MKNMNNIVVRSQKKHWYKIKVFKCDWSSRKYVNCNTLKKFRNYYMSVDGLVYNKMRKETLENVDGATVPFCPYKTK